MKRIFGFLFLIGLAAPIIGSSDAFADGYEDLDSPEGEKKTKKSKKSRKRDYSSEDVKEIVRGLYAKSNIGGWMYLGDFRGTVKPGTSLALAIGQDFVDNPSSSMAWEVAFFQGIHNGTSWKAQSPGNGQPLVEGDLRTYSLAGTLEWSTYLSRRLGLGLRAGGGLLFSPLLIEESAYEGEVLPSWGLDVASDPGYHDAAHPMVLGGPTVEYYAKLSHFSMGADIDAIYAIGFDLGLSITGTLKYTF